MPYLNGFINASARHKTSDKNQKNHPHRQLLFKVLNHHSKSRRFWQRLSFLELFGVVNNRAVLRPGVDNGLGCADAGSSGMSGRAKEMPFWGSGCPSSDASISSAVNRPAQNIIQKFWIIADYAGCQVI